MSFFSRSRNVHIEGGNFNSFSQTGLSAIQSLFQAIATSAIHDSDARHDPPKCHRETRKKILADIMSWIRNPDKLKILRVNGAAGAGKSAILQTIAELCEAERLLAASFFFSRASDECNSGKKLFSTLAYQLAISIGELQEHIESAFKSNPSIATKSMDKQLKKLILGPMSALLKQHSPQPLALPHVIIIDGLDECIEEKQQTDILRLLLEASNDPSFPFCIIIASRPEFNIANQFHSPEYQRATRTVSLDNRRDARTTKEDIRAYLRAEFDRIHDDPIHAMESIPKPWPSEYTINKLAGRSSGQFVYASTVIKFVENPDCSPYDQLRIMMILLKRHPEALVELDNLYTDILEKCPNRERTLEVLGYVLAMTQATDAYSETWGTQLNTSILLTVIDQFLGLNPGDASRSMRRLQPLISISNTDRQRPGHELGPGCNVRKGSMDEQMASLAGPGIKFNHASFSDFLRKPKRSGQFFIKVSAIHTKITLACLKVMSNFSQASVTQNEYLVWVYAVIFWCYHCTKSQHQEDLINSLHGFNVSEEWILVQSLPSLRVDEGRLRKALKTFDIQELKDCPAQGRWFVGNPDLQSMLKDLGSVTSWLKHPDNKTPADTISDTIQFYSQAFDGSFAQHLTQSPNLHTTLLILGILRSGETSEEMLLDLPGISASGLDPFIKPLELFLYRYHTPRTDHDCSSTSASSLSSSEPPSKCRLGLKSESFSRFLDQPRAAGRYLGSKIHLSIAVTLLGIASHAISKGWNATDYAQAWTYSLLRTRTYSDELIERLGLATSLYLSSSHLQKGLRRYHAKRVLACLKKGTAPQLSELIAKWSSPPIWKETWYVDKERSSGPFPSSVLYELAVVPPLASIRNDAY